MAFTLLQIGANLYSMNSQGEMSSALTLPPGITLATNLIPRFTRFKPSSTSNGYIIVANTPSRPITVDSNGVVRPLVPNAPGSAVVLSAGTAGTLNGGYLALETFVIKDALGNTIAESAPSPFMTTPLSVSNGTLSATILTSGETVSAQQMYRTTSNGAVYFPWKYIDGNFTTSFSNDNTADASLGLVAIANLGPAPDLTLVAEFNGRLFGVARSDPDTLRYTEAGTMYAWGGTNTVNTILMPHPGVDAAGITALIPRRHALGVARRDQFMQVTGADNASLAPQTVFGGEGVGCVSQESVVVYNDVAYFLWRDGVYKWSSTGIKSVTDGKVRSWFTTNTYFNRSMFWRAFAQLDPTGKKYRLFLAAPGSAVNNRWIEMDLDTGAWFGPHQTAAFTPTCAINVPGVDMQTYAMIGSQEGYVSRDQEARNDWDVNPIALSATTRQQFGDHDPNYDKYFGAVFLNLKTQPLVGNLTVTPAVGEIDTALLQAPMTTDQTQGRQRLNRLGVGKQATLTLAENTLNSDVVAYGYEIDDVDIVGLR